ncbi:unnamed protein product [Meganyctiphanes norvegica]|uniref:Caveolin n=1 Tax=Meganyctiphanes norvegica TaxID=48144 RepID=A0AAV2QWG6_MEGNR
MSSEAEKDNPHDPLNIHAKLNSDWSTVFAEPGESTTPDVLWNFYDVMYKTLFRIFYLIPAILIGPIVIILTALLMALQNFVLLWLMHPMFVCFKKCMVIQEKYFWVILETFMKPLFRVCGYCFSEFRIRYQRFENNSNTDIFIV